MMSISTFAITATVMFVCIAMASLMMDKMAR